MKDAGEAEFRIEGVGGNSVHSDLQSALEQFLKQKNDTFAQAKTLMSEYSSGTLPTQIKSDSPENFLS